MKTLRNEDPDATQYLKSIPRYVDTLTRNETPFFLIADDAWVRAIVSIHTEPYRFFSPAGNKLGRIVVLNPDLSFLDEVLEHARRLVQSEGLSYLVYSNSMIPDELKRKLEEFEFNEVDHSFSMYLDIHEPPEIPRGIIFRPITPAMRGDFMEIQSEFFKGSGDPVTEIIQDNLKTLTDSDLDSMFNEDTSFLAYQDDQIVGIVVISIDQGLLMSIAVSPKFRGKKISRKLLAFALIRLKEIGWGKAYLRVHVNNVPAIKLYESFGFVVENESLTYVYYPSRKIK
ncbi:MAG: GNAT family N-acetyltransferase [Candidatus Thorarchaeota archaeon]